MKVLGKEVDFSFTDVNNIEKIDTELKRVADTENKKFDNYIEELKFTCATVKKFFNNVIGEDFTKDVPDDYAYLTDEFDNFTTAYLQCTEKATKKLKEKRTKYDLKRIKR